MLIKVFALGRPGSGKSVAAHRLAEAAWNKGIPVMRLGDYEILQKEAWQEEAHFRAGALSADQRSFYLAEPNGFGVYDFSVLDRALLKLRDQVHERAERAKDDDQLVVLEFARNNYRDAFKLLGKEFLRDAFFLYVNANAEECIRRINKRTRHPTSSDDHYVPEAILRGYYKHDDGCDLKSHLAPYDVPSNHVIIVDNHSAPYEFSYKVTEVSKLILQQMLRSPSSPELAAV